MLGDFNMCCANMTYLLINLMSMIKCVWWISLGFFLQKTSRISDEIASVWKHDLCGDFLGFFNRKLQGFLMK